MGIRETQLVGLSKRAQALLMGLRPVKSGRVFGGMFPGEDYPLHNYVIPNDLIRSYEQEIALLTQKIWELNKLKDSELERQLVVYEEFVQAEPWSSGPMIFLGIRNAQGQEMTEHNWTEEEIDNES